MTDRLRDTPPARADDDADADLARRIATAGGDADAEAELCRRMLPRVRLFGLRHLRDPEAAADLAQHVTTLMLTKLRNRDVERPDRIASFVLGTARNAARDLARSDARWRRQAVPDAIDAVAADPAPEPIDTERLQRCLAALAERERTVVVLTFYDALTSAQIGGQIGASEGNVRVIRLRALHRLRACMAEAA